MYLCRYVDVYYESAALAERRAAAYHVTSVRDLPLRRRSSDVYCDDVMTCAQISVSRDEAEKTR